MPYLGFYLTDLAFIEDGTPNVTDDGLINFSKMRMVSGQIFVPFLLVKVGEVLLSALQ